jgi:hypothetical protein
MWDRYLGRQLRRANRNLIALNALVVLAVLVAALAANRYLYNFFFGPFRVDHETLADAEGPDDLYRYFITLDVSLEPAVIGKGFQRPAGQKNQPGDEQITAEYAVVPIYPGDQLRLLLVRKAPGTLGKRVTGYLADIPPDVRAKILEPWERETRSLKGATLTAFLLDTGNFRGPGYWEVAVGLPLLVLGLWNVTRGVGRALNPERHPLIAGLRRYGSPTEVMASIQGEVEQETPNARPSETVVTRSWVLQPTWFGLKIVHLEEVVWVYKKVTRHSTNGIPTGTTHAAVIHQRNGRAVEITGSDRGSDLVLQRIYHSAPWILAGFDARLADLWKNNRPALLGIADQRRLDYFQQKGSGVDERDKG